MTTERQRRANRANAKASTGPRTEKGKARAAQNALRHGLSVTILTDPLLSAEVEDLAHEIAGEGADTKVFACARDVATAQVDLVRIRQARHEMLSRKLDSEYEPRSHQQAVDRFVCNYAKRFGALTPFLPEHLQWIYWRPQGDEKLSCILTDFTKELILIDRYERRALSRRKFAIRALDAVRNR